MQLATINAPVCNGPQLNTITSAIVELTQNATIRSARFRDMVRSKLNVRKKGTDVSELKALILAQGLLHNLVGFMQILDGGETGVVEIVAGGRRYQALGELIAEGLLPDDFAIPYLLVTEEEAVEISLAENSGREDMHPADVYDAMMELSRRGRSVEDIAMLFKLDVMVVKKRLKLANIFPPLLDLYRNDEANFEQMIALAITDDHDAQKQAWDSLGPRNRYPHDIRRLLTAQQVNIRTDRLAKYVGIEAFEKAGGVVVRDLFSKVDDGYLSDVGLLERIALEKLEQERAKLLEEGCGWVDVMPRADYSTLSAFANVRSSISALTAEEAARLAGLDEQIIQLDDTIEELDEGEDDERFDELSAELADLERERDAIQKNRPRIENAADTALAGAVVTLDDCGNVVIKRNLIRPADKAKMVKLTGEAEPGAAPRRSKSVHSDRLTHELTSQRTAALQAEMMDQSDIALIYLTYTLMRKVFQAHAGGTLAKITISKPTLAEAAMNSPAAAAFRQRGEQLLERLPDDAVGGGWLQWLTLQSTPTVMEVLAFCVASTLDATQHREGAAPQFVTLAQGLKLDMSKWWRASAADYFNHVSKDRMTAVLTEALCVDAAVPLGKMKKGAAAEAAERALKDLKWLPDALRTDL